MDWSKLRRQEVERLKLEEIKFDNSGFVDGIAWTRRHKNMGVTQHYRRTECQFCGTSIGTCQGLIRFQELKTMHRNECPDTCGFRDCHDCASEPPVTVKYNAA